MANRIATLDLPEPACVKAETTLTEAVGLMQEQNLGCLLVTDEDDRIAGIFAQGDIFSQVARREMDMNATTVGSLMTPDPTTLSRSAPIGHVLHMMALHGFRHIPIVNREGKPVALASFKSVPESPGQPAEIGRFAKDPSKRPPHACGGRFFISR